MVKTVAVLLGISVLGLVAAGLAVMQQDVTFEQDTAGQTATPTATRITSTLPASAAPAGDLNDIGLLREEIALLKTAIQELTARQQPTVASQPAANDEPKQATVIDSELLQAAVNQAIGDALKRHEEWKNEEAKRKQEEAQREYQEMMKGPYGDHNYAVNYFGKQCGLNASQKDQYYTLLKWQADEYKKVQEWYQDEWARMQEQNIKTNGKEYKDLMAGYQQRYKDIQGRFDSDLSRMLTTEQYDNYKSGGAYPNWQGGHKRSERS